MPYRKGLRWIGQIRKGAKRQDKIFSSKREALEWEIERRRKSKLKIEKVTNNLCLADWAKDYLDYSRVRFSSQTYKEKLSVFHRLFLEVDPQTPADNLSKKDVLRYLQAQFLKRSGYAANKDRKNLIAGWNWGIKYLQLSSLNPCMVDRFPEVRHMRYMPPEQDFWAVYDQAKGQDKVMLLAFLHLAARRNELFSLKWEDVDFSNGMVRLWTRKRTYSNMEYESLPITDDLHRALLEHREKSHSQWVFTDPESGKPYKVRRRWLGQACKRAGVESFGMHAIRHLSASILAQANIPLVLIRAILRHKSMATTERYITRLSDLRPALKVLQKKSRLAEPSGPTRREDESEAIV